MKDKNKEPVVYIISVENDQTSDFPKWKRSILVDISGKMYFPSYLGGNEDTVFYKAAWDGNVKTIKQLNHWYFDAEWMLSEFPEIERFYLIQKKQLPQYLEKVLPAEEEYQRASAN